MKPLILRSKGEVLLGRDGFTLESLPETFQKSFPDVPPKYIDSLSLMAGIAAGRAFQGTQLSAEVRQNFAVILGSGFGAMDSVVDFDRQGLLNGPNTVNPMDFPNTVANAAGSRIGIWLQLKGPNVTLTNGDTAFIDAIGFAWEGFNDGLFRDCLVGAMEKIPAFLKPLAASPAAPKEIKEGACFLWASSAENQEALFEVTDYFSLQFKPDFRVPGGHLSRWEGLWGGVEWLGCPTHASFESLLPQNVSRYSPNPAVLELGLGGLDSLNHFLSSAGTQGIIAAVSESERKLSLIKVTKKKGDPQNGNN